MPAKKWITSKEAAGIMSENAGHTVTDAYVRRLAGKGKIGTKDIDERTKLYSRADAEGYIVKPRGDGSVRRSVRGKKQTAEVTINE